MEQLGQIQWKYSDPTRRIRGVVPRLDGGDQFIPLGEWLNNLPASMAWIRLIMKCQQTPVCQDLHITLYG